MKKLILVSLLASNVALANCNVRSASILADENTVGPVTNLVADFMPGRCRVSFDITVDGERHHVQNQLVADMPGDSVCNEAVEQGKKKLLLDTGGRFKTESITVCREGRAIPPTVKVGDQILESEVSKSKMDRYFTFRNSRCRMFTERAVKNQDLIVYHGVICQIDKSDTNWLVVDKW
jgi:hypothetical protein